MKLGRRIFPKFNWKNFKPHDGPQREFFEKPYHNNWLYAIYGTPEEREKKREKIVKNLVQEQIAINKKKELYMDDTKRELKHVIISNLTNELEDAAKNLQKLVTCVQGNPVAKEEIENKDVRDHGATPLSAFLDEHPKRIEEIAGKITEATNQLKALLY